MCSDAPDTSGLNKAAEKNAELGQQALDWYRQAYEDQAPARKAAADRSNKISDAQLDAMNTQTRIAKEADDYTKGTFRPLEKSIVDDAENFDTEGKREQLAGLALGDVNQSFASARDQADRALSRTGVNPNDGRALAVNETLTGQQALAGADARNKARMQAITLAAAKKMDAASLGRNLPSQQATSAGLALNAGNASAGNAQTPVTLARQATDQVGQGFSTAISANNSAGSLYGSAANIQNTANQQDNAIFGALGNVGGAAIFKYSDKTQKKNIKPIKPEIALAAARKMPAKSWQYKDSSPAADGGQTHVGPMAQDVKIALGNAAAPGGKMINRDSVADVTLAAVQALDKKVTRLQRRA